MGRTQLLLRIFHEDPHSGILTLTSKKAGQTGKILFGENIYLVGELFTGNTPKIIRSKENIRCTFTLEEGEYVFSYEYKGYLLDKQISVSPLCCHIVDFLIDFF